MLFPYYCVLQNGQISALPFAAFRLHNTAAEFRQAPRVFTTFVARKTPPEHRKRAFEVHGFLDHSARLLGDAEALCSSSLTSLHSPREHFQAMLLRINEELKRLLQEYYELLPSTVRVREILGEHCAELVLDEFRPRFLAGSPLRLRTVFGKRSNPHYKSTNTSCSVDAQKIALAAGADEALLFDEHGILEGAWSNFFWFNKQGELHTRAKDVLPGIVRKFILESTPCTLGSVHPQDIAEEVAEAFITLSTYGVVRVGEINNHLLSTEMKRSFYDSLFQTWGNIAQKHVSFL